MTFLDEGAVPGFDLGFGLRPGSVCHQSGDDLTGGSRPDMDKITFVPWCHSERDDVAGISLNPLPVDKGSVGITIK